MNRAPTADSIRAVMRERPLRSTFVKLASLEVVDLMASSGFDAIIVDLEHSQLDEADARRLVRHATAVGLPALVRIPNLDGGIVNRLLEAGAVGIQLSSVESPAQAEAFRRTTLYPPQGSRSVSLAQPAADYGSAELAAHVAHPGGPPLVVGQIETVRGVAAATEIVRHLDVAFIGTTDLAVAMGHAESTNHQDVRRAMDSIAVAARDGGTNCGLWASSRAHLDALEPLGATYVALGSDLALLAGAVRGAYQEFGDRSTNA